MSDMTEKPFVPSDDVLRTSLFEERGVLVVTPGRTELAGNHVDHQGGRALTGTVDRFITIGAVPNGLSLVRVSSAGFPDVEIDVNDTELRPDERFTSAALVRGVLAGLREAGVALEGFDAQVTSTIPVGRGLSSSAAFELAMVAAASQLFCRDGIDPETRVKIALAAEQDYFGKPCGAMDQRAIAYRGVVAHDFSAEAEAAGKMVKPIDVDLGGLGYVMCLVDTHCDHSLYPEEFSQVVGDMKDVAGFFGRERLGDISERVFLENLADVRRVLGDQPALRAMHFYQEVRLVDERVAALEAGDIEAFLTATRLSGASSAAFLQNVSTTDRHTQPAMVALAAVQRALGTKGACRIHGGGFGGTIQAFVPFDSYDGFVAQVEMLLGEGSCLKLGFSS